MKFKSWLIENSHFEYWGPYSRVEEDESFLVIKADDLNEPLYLPKNSTFTYINKWPVNKSLNPPWNKYFKYFKDTSGKNIITYTENRAVDVVCYNSNFRAIYLINRKNNPTGLALPGGFFDNKEDNFDANNPPEPKQIGKIAAARELKEETKARINPNELTFLGEFLTGSSDTREKIFKTWAYSFMVSEEFMNSFRSGDDAAQAEGSPKLQKLGYKGWYLIDNLPNLAFPHHKEIIYEIMQ